MADRLALAGRWLAVAIWMAIIFWFSHQETLPVAGHALLDIPLRKAGHAFVYAVLGILLLRALAPTARRPGRRLGALAVALAALYAVTDEFHQSLVPGREPRVSDVLIDIVGASLGVALLARWRSRRDREAPRSVPETAASIHENPEESGSARWAKR